MRLSIGFVGGLLYPIHLSSFKLAREKTLGGNPWCQGMLKNKFMTRRSFVRPIGPGLGCIIIICGPASRRAAAGCGRRSRSSSPSTLSNHFSSLVAERDVLSRNVRTLHAACSSLKQDLEKIERENAALNSELEDRNRSQASVDEKMAFLNEKVVVAAHEKQQLHTEIEDLKRKLFRAKEHYKEHDANRQHFLDTKHAEMKAVKKELKKANEMQKETQALLLRQLDDHRSLQQAHQVIHLFLHGP